MSDSDPPAAGKYCFWTAAKTPADPDAWFLAAKQTDGSWWPDWDGWLKKQSGKNRVPARAPGKGGLKALADAPGTYIMMKAID